MTETDIKTQRQADFMQKHTMTEADKRKLILEKLARAEAYSKAVRKRETVLQDYR